MAALVASSRWGIHWLDPAVALAACALLALGARRIGLGAWDALMDRAAQPALITEVERIVAAPPGRPRLPRPQDPDGRQPRLHPGPCRARRRAVAAARPTRSAPACAARCSTRSRTPMSSSTRTRARSCGHRSWRAADTSRRGRSGRRRSARRWRRRLRAGLSACVRPAAGFRPPDGIARKAGAGGRQGRAVARRPSDGAARPGRRPRSGRLEAALLEQGLDPRHPAAEGHVEVAPPRASRRRSGCSPRAAAPWPGRTTSPVSRNAAKASASITSDHM